MCRHTTVHMCRHTPAAWGVFGGILVNLAGMVDVNSYVHRSVMMMIRFVSDRGGKFKVRQIWLFSANTSDRRSKLVLLISTFYFGTHEV